MGRVLGHLQYNRRDSRKNGGMYDLGRAGAIPLQVVVCLSLSRRMAITIEPHGEKHAKRPMKTGFFVVDASRQNIYYATLPGKKGLTSLSPSERVAP